ncbi:MAG: TolC family protein [Pirellulales bacterium]
MLNDVRVEFYNVLIAQRTTALARDLVADAIRRAEIAAKGREQFQLSAFEETQVQIDLHAVELMQQRAENRLAAAWRRLVGAAGIPLTPLAPLEGDVEAAIPEFTWDESLARLLSSSPELSAAAAEVAQARFRLAGAQAQVYPNVELQAGVQHDNGTGDDVANVQVAIPVPLFNRNQGAIRQAAGQLRDAQADVARIELRLHNQLSSMFERYQNARRQVEKYQRETLPRIQKSQELLREQAVRGQELSELEARYYAQTYRYITLAYLDALRDLWESSVSIEGLLLTDSLQAGTPPVPSIGIGPGGIPLGGTPLSR